MSLTRTCTRCARGTETCVIGDYYHCGMCDAQPKPEPISVNLEDVPELEPYKGFPYMSYFRQATANPLSFDSRKALELVIEANMPECNIVIDLDWTGNYKALAEYNGDVRAAKMNADWLTNPPDEQVFINALRQWRIDLGLPV